MENHLPNPVRPIRILGHAVSTLQCAINIPRLDKSCILGLDRPGAASLHGQHPDLRQNLGRTQPNDSRSPDKTTIQRTATISRKVLNRRQARWAQELAGIEFRIYYRPGSKNCKPAALLRHSKSKCTFRFFVEHFYYVCNRNIIPVITSKILHKNHDGTTLSANKFLTYKKEDLGIVYMINKSLLIPVTFGLALLDVNWISSSCFSTCNRNYDTNGSKLTVL